MKEIHITNAIDLEKALLAAESAFSSIEMLYGVDLYKYKDEMRFLREHLEYINTSGYVKITIKRYEMRKEKRNGQENEKEN